MSDEEGNETLELIIEIDDTDMPWKRLCDDIKECGQYRGTGGGHIMYNPMEGYGELVERKSGRGGQGLDGGEARGLRTGVEGDVKEDGKGREEVGEAGEYYDRSEFDPLESVASAAGWV